VKVAESESGCTVQLFSARKQFLHLDDTWGGQRAIEIFPELHSANTGMNITYTGLYLKNIKESER
jgi:hypothetical protein